MTLPSLLAIATFAMARRPWHRRLPERGGDLSSPCSPRRCIRQWPAVFGSGLLRVCQVGGGKPSLAPGRGAPRPEQVSGHTFSRGRRERFSVPAVSTSAMLNRLRWFSSSVADGCWISRLAVHQLPSTPVRPLPSRAWTTRKPPSPTRASREGRLESPIVRLITGSALSKGILKKRQVAGFTFSPLSTACVKLSQVGP